jgi:glycosyltransferase involved in cell wall biosynthesis
MDANRQDFSLTTVSIIICTRNHAASLQATLEGVKRAQAVSTIPSELLVVDNGSNDATAAVVAGLAGGPAPVRHILEPRTGQCYARNRGLSEARGEVMLFTDDDVKVPENWIEGMCAAIVAGEADGLAGGVVLADHLKGRAAEYEHWFAGTKGLSGESPGRFVGANMAFGRHVLERVSGFDVELGPGALGFHDETLFAMQLQEAGYRIRGALNVEVVHHFDESRLSRAGLLGIAARIGRSDAYLHYHWLHEEVEPGDGRAPRLKLGLIAGRILGRHRSGRRDWPSEWEIERVKELAYIKQLEAERKRMRLYARRGLRKNGESGAPIRMGMEAPVGIVR